MGASDEALVQAIKFGNQDAMDQLVRKWYPRIYAYVLRMAGKEADAYDITQETFLSMIKTIENFKPWSRFQSWLFTIAHNKCMDFFRLQGAVNVHTELLDEEAHKTTAADIDIEEMIINAVAVDNALKELSVAHREVIILYYFNDFNTRQIAQMTNTPISTIKSRLSAAKKVLADYLKEELG